MRVLTAEETDNALQRHGLDQPSGIGFAFRDTDPHQFYDWHAHAYHQLLYASDGAAQIETVQGRYLLPRARAAWIPAGTQHRTLISSVEGTSIFLSPTVVRDSSRRARIIVADPLMREMMLFAGRWEKGAAELDPLARSFLSTLALLCERWLEEELPLFLPRTDHPAIARAMDQALAAPGTACLADAIQAAALSERTFRRTFAREAGIGWQTWLTHARILKAMALLAEGQRVTAVSAEVGYESLSAFAKAFAALTGEAPARFRERHCRAR